MKRITLLTISFLSLVLCQAQTITWKDENLKYKVKVCTTYADDWELKRYMHFTADGKLIEVYNLKKGDSKKFNFTHYNFKIANQIEHVDENYPSLNQKIKYFYNSKKELTTSMEYIPLTKKTFVYQYTYDEGCLIEKKGYFENTNSQPYKIWYYKCDQNNKVIEEKSDYIVWSTAYDNRGNKIRYACPENGEIFVIDYIYNKNNVLIESIETHHVLQSIKIQKFDSFGNLISDRFAAEKIKSDIVFKYVYDNFGNWTEQQEFKNGVLTSTIKREYSYYK